MSETRADVLREMLVEQVDDTAAQPLEPDDDLDGAVAS
jgi:hypothetical protein